MSRNYARAPIGVRAEVKEPYRRQRVSVIGALTIEGFKAPMTIEGAFDSDSFDLYVEHALVPELTAGKIVILDNIRFHHSRKAEELIKVAGASLIHLPSYSPDFNPIEECISKIKSVMRSLKARTVVSLGDALKTAILKISKNDIIGWFTHAGYQSSLE